mgnify:CR=1 FL=1|jgi:hypothetical protein
MESIYQFASITQKMAGITASLNDLAYRYKELEARSTLDEAHIDVLVTQANGLIAAAENLKTIDYDPTTVSEELGK